MLDFQVAFVYSAMFKIHHEGKKIKKNIADYYIDTNTKSYHIIIIKYII